MAIKMPTGMKTVVKKILYKLPESRLAARLVQFMALTGVGTDACLERGCLPVRVHFYQPIPDLKDLEARKVWDKVSSLKGIDWDDNRFLNELESLSEYAAECDWSKEPSKNPADFHWDNGAFSYGCAAMLHCHIRKHKPKNIIEVGSGNSSKVIAAAINKNLTENRDYVCNYTIIDPYTALDISLFPKGTSILKKPIETVDLEIFSALGEDDILFIDSSHVCRIGGDVNYEILEILPSLNKGVQIHFHDIDLPYEYSKAYAYNKQFRMFWTESYLLQAFLAFNSAFEVYMPMAYMQRTHLSRLKDLYPKGEVWNSGSFWIKKVL